MEAAIIVAHFEQHEVVVHEPHAVAAHRLDHPGHRRYGGHRPYADQAHILVAFHLVSEQQKLCKDHHQQHTQVAVAI